MDTNENITSGILMNRAATAGLALGAVSTAYLFAVQYLPHIIPSPVVVGIVTAILWIAKFTGCILILRAFMLNLADSYEGICRRQTMQLGILASLFSALIFSAANLADVLYICPDTVEQTLDLALSQYSTALGSNELEMLDTFKENIPSITFFSNLIYCFLYGTVLSAIMSRYIPKADPFAGFHDGPDIEEQ